MSRLTQTVIKRDDKLLRHNIANSLCLKAEETG